MPVELQDPKEVASVCGSEFHNSSFIEMRWRDRRLPITID
jgi:hypothetical protein